MLSLCPVGSLPQPLDGCLYRDLVQAKCRTMAPLCL